MEEDVGLEGDHDLHDEKLMLATKPIVARPGQSLIWALQTSTSDAEIESNFSAEVEEPGEVISEFDALTHKVHTVELIRKQ